MTVASRPWHARLTPASAWRGTTAAAVFTIFGLFMTMRAVRVTEGAPQLPMIVSMIASSAILVILFLRRRQQSVRLAEFLYVVNVVSVTSAIVAANQFLVAFPDKWVPFQAQKLGCLVAALVAPSFATGLVGIAMHGGSAIIQYVLFAVAIRDNIAFGEPWASIGFAFAGAVTLVYRYSSVGLEQRIARAVAEGQAMQRVTEVSFAMKDLMNTPLQTLTFAVAVLRSNRPQPDEVLNRIESSVKSLTEINKRLTEYESEARAHMPRQG